jgi:outer membrane immunogenic protein
MKKFLLATTAAIALAAPGHAADLPLNAPPVAVEVFSWTGFYVGGNTGVAWSRDRAITVVPTGFSPAPGTAAVYSNVASPHVKGSGFIGGGQAGYNTQHGNIVFGVEIDFNAFLLRGTGDGTGVPLNSVGLSSHAEVNTDWLLTVRPRLGLVRDRGLAYITGGLAVTEIRYSQVNTFFGGVGPEAASVSQTKTGWTAGGGVEYAVTGNWSVKVEYLYVSFGTLSTTSFHPTLNSTAIFTHQTDDLRVHIARVGLNYRFGGPVVARY